MYKLSTVFSGAAQQHYKYYISIKKHLNLQLLQKVNISSGL